MLVLFRTVSCSAAEPEALAEASTPRHTAHDLRARSGELRSGAGAERAAGGAQREAQLHMAEEEQKERLAAAWAGRETALESGPMSSVCL